MDRNKMNRWTGAQRDGRTNGEIVRRTDGRKDAWTDIEMGR